MGKEEIARNEQFLLFPQCFQKLLVVDQYLWSKGLNVAQMIKFVFNRIENIVEKGENAN